jgi:hypothetical protein
MQSRSARSSSLPRIAWFVASFLVLNETASVKVPDAGRGNVAPDASRTTSSAFGWQCATANEGNDEDHEHSMHSIF